MDLEIVAAGLVQRGGAGRKLRRAWQVLRHYRTRQLVTRAWKLLSARLGADRIAIPERLGECTIREGAVEKLAKILAGRQRRGVLSPEQLLANLAAGKVTLLGQQVDFRGEIDWEGREQKHPNRLWTFQLQYQDYLVDLIAPCTAEVGTVEDEPSWRLAWELVGKWRAANPLPRHLGNGDAWHPYCISRRLPIWMLLWAGRVPRAEQREGILESIVDQAQVLAAHLEFDLGGNHLLENLHALGMAGCFLSGSRAEEWLERVETLLRRKLAEQILSHGEHYERAPMYHCQVLGNLLQLALFADGVCESLAKLCRCQAERMLEFLEGFLHPDGEIPLFGDSSWGEAHSADEIRRWATVLGIKSASPKTGANLVGPYWVWREQDDALILDLGAVGACSLPAHAHCDLHTFEASVQGRRWFVDSGLYDYDETAMRDYCRSSLAHNVVTVGDENSCEVWSRFRMGRRGQITRLESGEQGEFRWCVSSHDGYRGLGVPELSRLLVVDPAGTWICIEYAEAGLHAKLAGRLHLRPGIQVTIEESDLLRLEDHGECRWLRALGCRQWALDQGWYCPRFGVRERSQVIRYSPEKDAVPSVVWGWTLARSVEGCASLEFPDGPQQSLRLRVGETRQCFEWDF